ncbi:MAG TPA: redoxin domain-containing protein [Candidatus Acidoferrales bacterium]|nr:redoxin domain-containing protein [Candidatus Acidoferrales bacterium]
MSIEIGQKMLDFQLPDQDRKQRSLKEFQGKKVVLAFFPGAFTGVCDKEMCTFRDSLASLPGQVVAVSVNDPFTNKAFANANKLQFPILSDYMRETIKKLNILHNDFAGLKGYTAAKRSVFVLDPTGAVRYRWISEDPGKEPNYDEVKSALAKL